MQEANEHEARMAAFKLCNSGAEITARQLAEEVEGWGEVRCLILLGAMARDGSLNRVHGRGVGSNALYCLTHAPQGC